MEKIKSLKETQKIWAEWKREHPKETEMLEEPKWTYLDWKHFMESKGFTFAMSDEEFVRRCEWLNMSFWERLKKWLKKKPDPEKLIKGYRRVAMMYAGIGVLCFAISFFAVYQMAQSYKAGGFEIISSEGWRALAFLSCLSIFLTIGIITAGLMFLSASNFYSQSLELRIKQLEKKLEAVEIEQGEEKPANRE